MPNCENFVHTIGKRAETLARKKSCNDAVFGRNKFILIFMQRSVYNVVFVSCEIIFEKLDLSKKSIEG